MCSFAINMFYFVFFVHDTAVTSIYTYRHTRSLRDARPISRPNIGPANLPRVGLQCGGTDSTVHSPQSESVPSTLWAARNAGLFHFLLQTRFSPGPLFPRRLRFKISRTGPKEIHACVCARDGRSDGVHRIHAPGHAAAEALRFQSAR